jgi:hypothetical protein
MIDAPPGAGEHRQLADLARQSRAELRVKIGQTALHNPGGRSSWIGL